MSNILSLAIYISTFGVSTASVYFATRSQRKSISIILFLIAIFLPAGIAALRESGTDFQTYRIIYDYSRRNPFRYPIEYGWLFLNFISPNFETLLFISALTFLAFALGGCMRVLHKDVWLAWGAFLLVFYAIFLNGMRQMLASAIVFYAFYDLLRKKHASYFCCILFAVLFHKTAILMVFAPVVIFLAEKVKRIDLFLLIVSTFAIVLLPIILIVIRLLLGENSKYNTIIFQPSFGYLFYMLPPIIYYYVKRVSLEKNQDVKALFGLYFCCIPIQIIGCYIPFADRMIWYFEPALVLLIPIIIQDYAVIPNRRKIEWRYEGEWTSHEVKREMIWNANQRIWLTPSGYMVIAGNRTACPIGDYTLEKPLKWGKWIYLAWFVFYFLVMEFLMNGNYLFPYA